MMLSSPLRIWLQLVYTFARHPTLSKGIKWDVGMSQKRFLNNKSLYLLNCARYGRGYYWPLIVAYALSIGDKFDDLEWPWTHVRCLLAIFRDFYQLSQLPTPSRMETGIQCATNLVSDGRRRRLRVVRELRVIYFGLSWRRSDHQIRLCRM